LAVTIRNCCWLPDEQGRVDDAKTERDLNDVPKGIGDGAKV